MTAFIYDFWEIVAGILALGGIALVMRRVSKVQEWMYAVEHGGKRKKRRKKRC